MTVKIDKGRSAGLVNLTPMIDVVFQLLIFFMVATTFLDPEKEIDIELPEAASGAPAEETDELIINIMEDGSIILSGESLDDASLLARLKAAAQADPDTPVTIRGDRLVRHERVVMVMDACGQAGLLNLAVGTLEGT
jgi:biopolymer transport protein ExbD